MYFEDISLYFWGIIDYTLSSETSEITAQYLILLNEADNNDKALAQTAI